MFLSASNASLCRWPPPPQEFAKHSISSRAQTPSPPLLQGLRAAHCPRHSGSVLAGTNAVM